MEDEAGAVNVKRVRSAQLHPQMKIWVLTVTILRWQRNQHAKQAVLCLNDLIHFRDSLYMNKTKVEQDNFLLRFMRVNFHQWIMKAKIKLMMWRNWCHILKMFLRKVMSSIQKFYKEMLMILKTKLSIMKSLYIKDDCDTWLLWISLIVSNHCIKIWTIALSVKHTTMCFILDLRCQKQISLLWKLFSCLNLKQQCKFTNILLTSYSVIYLEM